MLKKTHPNLCIRRILCVLFSAAVSVASSAVAGEEAASTAAQTEPELDAPKTSEKTDDEDSVPPGDGESEATAVESDGPDKPVEDSPAETPAVDETKKTESDASETEITDASAAVSTDKKRGFFPTEFDGAAAVRRDRGINILTARATRPMALTLVIDHRPWMKLAAEEAEDVFFDYLGLDGQLKIGLGLRFGILEGLDVGIYRLNDGGTVPFDTYELDARYAFLKQEKHFVDVSIRAGISWFSQKDAKDAVGGFGELFVDRIFFDMLLVGVGFQIHSDSTNDAKTGSDDNFSGAVLGVLEWRMIKQLALTAEIAAAVVGYGSEYGNAARPSFPAFSFGIKVLTHRHTFALLVSNTQFINADGIVSNSWREFSDVIFGFQILREFNFK